MTWSNPLDVIPNNNLLMSMTELPERSLQWQPYMRKMTFTYGWDTAGSGRNKPISFQRECWWSRSGINDKKDIHHCKNVRTPSNVDKYQVLQSRQPCSQYACFHTNSDIDGNHNWYTRCLTNKGGLHQLTPDMQLCQRRVRQHVHHEHKGRH